MLNFSVHLEGITVSRDLLDPYHTSSLWFCSFVLRQRKQNAVLFGFLHSIVEYSYKLEIAFVYASAWRTRRSQSLDSNQHRKWLITIDPARLKCVTNLKSNKEMQSLVCLSEVYMTWACLSAIHMWVASMYCRVYKLSASWICVRTEDFLDPDNIRPTLKWLKEIQVIRV